MDLGKCPQCIIKNKKFQSNMYDMIHFIKNTK